MTNRNGHHLTNLISNTAAKRGVDDGDAAMAVMTAITEKMGSLPETLIGGLHAAERRWVSGRAEPEELLPWRIRAWEFLDSKNGNSTTIEDHEDAAVRGLICVLWDEGITSADDFEMTLDFFVQLMDKFDSLDLPEA